MRYRWSLVLAYLALMALWIYGIANRWDPGSGTWLLPLLVLVQLAAGFAIGRWWAVLLPVVVVFVSVPAGNPPITPAYVEPWPIWSGLAIGAPVGCLLVVIGVAARKILDRLNWGYGARAT